MVCLLDIFYMQNGNIKEAKMTKRKIHKLRLLWDQINNSDAAMTIGLKLDTSYGVEAGLFPVYNTDNWDKGFSFLIVAYVEDMCIGVFDSAYDAEMAIIIKIRQRLHGNLKQIEKDMDYSKWINSKK